MKPACKLVCILVVFFNILPWYAIKAADGASMDTTNVESVLAQLYEKATVREEGRKYDLPHRDIFINSPEIQQETTRAIAHGDSVEYINGHPYVPGPSVKTRGRVDVPTLVAQDESSEDEIDWELAIMRRYYPEAAILDMPTTRYNCHSYAWCEDPLWRERWITAVVLFVSDLHSIHDISDEDAQPGDLVVYFDKPDHIAHSAVISEVGPGGIYCISKWGASVLCRHEINYVPDTYKYLEQECKTLIIRRSEHTGPGVSVGADEHIRTCTICGYEQQLACDYSYTYAGGNRHTARCLGCSRVNYYLGCSHCKISNADGTHTVTCEQCNHMYTENCHLEYTNLTDTRHSVACTECDYSIASRLCQLVYTTGANGTHTATCTLCENQFADQCNWIYESNGAGQHVRSCNQCNTSITENCHLECNAISGTHHAVECSKCDYSVSSAPCAFFYTSNGDGTHAKRCSVCLQEQAGTAGTCTYIYKSNGNNTHSQVCRDCGHLMLGPSPCMFKSDGRCRFCGAMKDSAVINSLEAEFGEE